MTDQIKTVSAVSAIFDIIEGQNNPESSVEYRARFYKTIPGIHWPSDWEELPLEEKQRRLDALDSLGLKEDHSEN